MNKKIIIALLLVVGLFFVNGCAHVCPDSCEDDNPCTNDFCSNKTNFKCKHIIDSNCCLDDEYCEKEIAMGKHKSKEGKIVISEELKKYSGEKIDTVVLACTLFQSIKNQIIEILGVDVKCIDPAKEVSNLAMGKLGIIAKIKRPKLIIWDTSRNESSVNSIKIACLANINRTIEVNYLKLIR